MSVRLLLFALAALAAGCSPSAPAAPAARLPLKLLTGLPIVFGEGFALDRRPHPLMAALDARFAVTPIDASAPEALGAGGVLLMLQPRAQTAENLVALDRWVRAGGRLLLVADPTLDWPSDKPLGDVTRAPLAFADTGLLAHWGLALSGDGPARMRLAGREIALSSAGRLSPAGQAAASGPACGIESGGAIARCRIGAGRVTVVADADWLDGTDEAALDALASEAVALAR